MGFGEIDIPFWEESGHILKICRVTGARFWTRDSSRDTCGDTNEDPYTFIGNPIIDGFAFLAVGAMKLTPAAIANDIGRFG